jgi:hypothetical protein
MATLVMNRVRWVCLLCGRNRFSQPSPHICGSQWRKQGLKWQMVQ